MHLSARAFVVAGLSRKAGVASEPWLESEFEARPGFSADTVAVLASVPAPFRFLAFRGVRAAASRDARRTFLVTFSDEAAWKALADYGAPDDPYLVLLDRRGEVVANCHGPFLESAYAELAAAIVRTLSGETEGH